MEIIVDASVIIAALTNEARRPAVLRVTAGAELCAPASIPWEIGNAFSAMLKRGRIDREQARVAIQAYGVIPLRYVHIDLAAALDIAASLGIYAYDAYLLETASECGAPLLTLDRSLAQVAPKVGVRVLEVL